jgi:hypothetical protein
MQGVKQGFIPDILKPEDYFFGSQEIPVEILQNDGNWRSYLPKEEQQYNAFFDTINCTVFTQLNAIEVLDRRKYGIQSEYSERGLGIAAETTPQGNSPQNVSETVRKIGLFDDAFLPFSEDIQSFNQYYSPKPLPESLLKIAREWLTWYEFKHDWITVNKPADPQVLMKALKCSPLGVAVPEWAPDNKGLYVKVGGVEIHYCLLVNYKEGEYWEVFDQYAPFVKRLAWDFPLTYVKRYYLRRRTQKETEDMKKLNELQVSVIGLLKQLVRVLSLKVAKLTQSA